MIIVYLATNKTNGRQYVGCTTAGLIARKNQHACEARRGKSGKFLDAIRHYGVNGFDWAVVKEFDSAIDALAYEQQLIEEKNLRDIGYNTREGGFSFGGRKRTNDEKELFRRLAHEWQAKQPNFGEEQSRKLKLFYQTPEGMRQLATRKATANRPDVRAAMSRSHGGRPVEMLKDGVVVRTFLTQGECAREIGTSQGNVNNCLYGRGRTLFGHTFRFAAAGDQIHANTENGDKKVLA